VRKLLLFILSSLLVLLPLPSFSLTQGGLSSGQGGAGGVIGVNGCSSDTTLIISDGTDGTGLQCNVDATHTGKLTINKNVGAEVSMLTLEDGAGDKRLDFINTLGTAGEIDFYLSDVLQGGMWGQNGLNFFGNTGGFNFTAGSDNADFEVAALVVDAGIAFISTTGAFRLGVQDNAGIKAVSFYEADDDTNLHEGRMTLGADAIEYLIAGSIAHIRALSANTSIALTATGTGVIDIKSPLEFDRTDISISGGSAAITKSYHRIDGGGTLNTLTGGTPGKILCIERGDTDFVIDCVAGSGNISCPGASLDISLADEEGHCMFFNGALWLSLTFGSP